MLTSKKKEMNRIYLIIVLLVAAVFVGCSKDETDGMPNVDVGAVANLAKDATTESNLPPDDLSTMNVKFDLEVIADDEVSQVEITADFNDGQVVGVYEVVGTKQAKIDVTLDRLLDALPGLTADDFIKGSLVSFYVTEIVMEDGRVFNDDEIITNEKEDDDTPSTLNPANLTGDFTTPNAVFNLRVDYFVACPSAIEGTYTLTFTGEGGGALGDLVAYNVTIENVTIERVSPIEYTVSNCMGSLMEHFYSAYGGSTIKGNFYDICGEFKPTGPINNGWHANTYTNGTVGVDGVITVKVNNNWGDNGVMVYTPVN